MITLDDPNPEIRREAARRALIDALPRAERPLATGAIDRAPTDALVAAARATGAEREARWLGLLLDAAGAPPDSGVLRDGALRLAIARVARGVDPGASWPTVLRLLADPQLAALAAFVVYAAGTPPSGAAAHLIPLLDGPEEAAYAAGRALTTLALRQGAPVTPWARHDRAAVREGAVYAIDAALSRGDVPGSVIDDLAAALGDPAGAVYWHAVQALERAAARRISLEAALPALAAARATYPEAGWLFGWPQTTGDERLDEHAPGRQCAWIAHTHRLNAGRFDEVWAAARGGDSAAQAALRAYAASGAPDAGRAAG